MNELLNFSLTNEAILSRIRKIESRVDRLENRPGLWVLLKNIINRKGKNEMEKISIPTNLVDALLANVSNSNWNAVATISNEIREICED